MSRLRSLIVLLLVVLVAGACGSGGRTADLASEAKDGGTETTPTTSPGPEQTVAPVSQEDLAELARKSDEAVRVAAAGEGGTTATTVFDPASHPLAPKNPQPMRYGQPRHPQADTVPVALRVDAASCAKLGSTLKVTVTSEPDVDIAMIIGFADGNGYDSQSLGTTGPEGRLVLDLPISPEAPTGDAQLMVIAGAPDGRRNHNERELQIVKATGTCA